MKDTKGYTFIDGLTSDVMFEATGKTQKELFEHASQALFSVICDMPNVKPERTVEIAVEAESLEELMVNWLQELIALVDTEELFFSRFTIREIDEMHLTATASGEPITPAKARVLVKGVTYYKLKIESIRGSYRATVSLDI